MITEDKLKERAEVLNQIKNELDDEKKEKARKLLNRKRDHEEALYLNKLMGGL